MEDFQCYYCEQTSDQFSNIVDHTTNKHEDEILKLKVVKYCREENKIISKTKNFSIIPRDLKYENQSIIPVEESRTIQISNVIDIFHSSLQTNFTHDAIFESPVKKLSKLSSTPIQQENVMQTSVEYENECSDEDTVDLSELIDEMSITDKATQTDNNCITFDIDKEDESTTQMVQTVVELIPDVLGYLKSVGKEEMYVTFTKLLAERRLPLTNIAFLLFEDVIQWFSTDNTHTMRYSEEVKQFWKIGLKLFKGRFLRFMCGWKNQGQNAKGNTKSENSCINFAVPSRSCLDDCYLSKKLQNIKPGILCDMIELVSQNDPDKNKTFKVCFDGKKINMGVANQKHGDINLWGLEGPPSLAKEENELESDQATLNELSSLLDQVETRDIECLRDCTEMLKEKLQAKGEESIGIVSMKLKKLREVKQKKVVTLERLKSACTNDQLRSKYSYALSAIKTHVHQIDACIKRLLKAVDALGEMCAECNDARHLYQLGPCCDLSCQQNYVCLTGPTIESVPDIKTTPASKVKQRSSTWFELRKLGKVTGSTCFQALGLSGLKKMKEHYAQSEDESLLAEETQKKLKHGVDNEINGIATLVGKVLPAFLPKTTYFEEGCEIVEGNGKPFLIVSSDGTIRETNDTANTSNVVEAVEVKCPYPGKLYTTPVHYKMPWYYVTQVLAEMHSLNVPSLLFLSYTEDSTTVFHVFYDPELWEEIMERLVKIDEMENISKLKKLPEGLSDLKQKIMGFCDENVKFVAEMPSLKANRQCSHSDVSSDENQIGHHAHGTKEDFCNQAPSLKSCTVSELMADVHDMKEGVSDAYSLCRRIASEVLVFLISDLDRIHEMEKQYAVPIAYAMKGYSLTSEVIRQMMMDVLQKCFDIGVYVPAVSYDGQWSKLAIRTKTGLPLTKLQLQKDVYKEAKKCTRKEIVDLLKDSNVVRADTLKDVQDKTRCCMHMDMNNHFNGNIQLYRSKECQHVFKTSVTVQKMLKSKQVISQACDEERNSENNVLLENISPAIAETIEEDVLDNMDIVSTTNASNTAEMQLDISDIFQIDHINVDEVDHQNESIEIEISNENQVPMDVVQETIDTDNDKNTQSTSTRNNIVTLSDKHVMLTTLSNDVKVMPGKWTDTSFSTFEEMFETEVTIKKSFTVYELQTCIKTISGQLKGANIYFALSWKKDMLVAFMYKVMNEKLSELDLKPLKVKSASSLKTLCIKCINKFPKHVLSSIYAEYLYPSKEQEWQKMSPFAVETKLTGIDKPIVWYSMPEYVEETCTYLFGLLDCHHLFVNARVKCCSTGMEGCGIKREAWVKVAKKNSENNSGLNLALVEDLLDKQSSAYAQKTFSSKVEEEMRRNGDDNEADFCKLIREWYSAEDDPGIDILERTRRRLSFREWLLKDVDFNQFPPPGMHVKGIPHVMFEGILTNIERRIQVIPFVKSGAYNPRSLGSLEAENFFGEFQDLDPKGSGVIRPDDIPNAITTGCELIGPRLDPNRKFFMHTSRAKVYPAHQLSQGRDGASNEILYMTPSFVENIVLRNHFFDEPPRAARKTVKRKSGEISKPGMSSRGVRPVREHHRCDESKVLPHIRLGIRLPDL